MVWDRRYAEAVTRADQALAAGDFRTAAALGRHAAVVGPRDLERLVRASLAEGDGASAVVLLDAHLAGGAPVAILAAPWGGGRLIEAAEAALQRGLGRDPDGDAEAAARLAGLFLRIDPTDSYAFAARWRAAASGFAEAGVRQPPDPSGQAWGAPPASPAAALAPSRRRLASGRAGVPEAAARFMRGIWHDWFGWRIDGQGQGTVAAPERGRPTPCCTLRGVPLLGGGRADVRIDGTVVTVRTAGGTSRAGRVGREIAL